MNTRRIFLLALVDQLRVQEYGGNGGVDVGHDYSMDLVVVECDHIPSNLAIFPFI